MTEAIRLRTLASEVLTVGRGLPAVLGAVRARHRGAVWTSNAADLSRRRLVGRHQHALDRAETELAMAAGVLIDRAQAADAAALGE